MYLINDDVAIKEVERKDLPEFWRIAYGPEADLAWRNFDAPYFNQPIPRWEVFFSGLGESAINNSHCGLIYYQGEMVGLVTAYWTDNMLQHWLEFGIALYKKQYWHHGIGKKALDLWIDYLFNQHLHIQHLGYTTWSGNLAMIKLGEKCGLKEEGRIRQVRFYKNNYYDELKFGILRHERFD